MKLLKLLPSLDPSLCEKFQKYLNSPDKKAYRRITNFSIAALFLLSLGVYHQDAFAEPQVLFGFGVQGSGDGQFDIPRDVAFDSTGRIIVADTANHRIQVFDSDGAFLFKFGSQGSGSSQFNNPFAVAVDDSDNIYVADASNQRIQKFDSGGNFLGSFGSFGSGDGQFFAPIGIGVADSGRIAVSDVARDDVQIFDSSFGFLFKIGQTSSPGFANGQFNDPRGVDFDSNGRILVADYTNRRIQVFDSDGTFLFKFGSQGVGDGQFNSVPGVASDETDNIIAVSDNPSNLQAFDPNGGFIFRFGSIGCGAELGKFCEPFGVDADATGLIAVADTQNHRIQVIKSNIGDQAPPTQPEITINNQAENEGNTGDFTIMSFQVSLNQTSDDAITVDYATGDGTATAGSDYQEANGQLNFAPGETVKEIPITIIGDDADEPDETFAVDLTNPTNSVFANNEGKGTILDDDEPPPQNGVPVVDAGEDQTVNVGDTVFLDGSGSSDPDGDILTYSWEIIQKPADSNALLSDPSISNPTFLADKAGEYMVDLIVDDGVDSSNSDSVTITAQPVPSTIEEFFNEVVSIFTTFTIQVIKPIISGPFEETMPIDESFSLLTIQPVMQESHQTVAINDVFTIEIIPTATIDNLVVVVLESDLDEGIETALVSNLNDMQIVLANEQVSTASLSESLKSAKQNNNQNVDMCGKLSSFINKVEAISGKKIPEEDAILFLDLALQIKENLGCK